jgi:3-oxoacyl-[acyl-carrier protein] reductase
MGEFDGRRVVVCGGSRGIGRSVALGFAEAGAAVSVCARGAGPLEATRAEIAAKGVAAHAAPCDLADGTAVLAYVEDAARALGGIDVLVNNASGFGAPDTEEGWAAGLSVDVMATVRASRAALPHLERSRGGCIVNVSSISGFMPSTRTPAYAAVKALLVNYTASQAQMHAAKGVRVNGVAPGSIEFPGGSWEQRQTTDPELYGSILRSIPFGRLGTPEEVAEVVLFLASPRARWVTGQTVIVDGGQMWG